MENAMIMQVFFVVAAFMEIYAGIHQFNGRGIASIHFLVGAICLAVSDLPRRIKKLEENRATRL
jgi:hypothetical protein